MPPISVTQVAAGSSNALTPDYFLNPFSLGLGAVLTGTATFTVEYSYDAPEAGATWFPVTGLTSVEASTSVAFSIPCRAIRVTLAEGSTGTVKLYMQQAGTR